jgi:DNA-directed RNA polymerase specialized sigma24 family protein
MLALQNIIDCLPPKCRQVFWMHRIEGKLQTDVATELNISLNMVERHMIRALVDISLAKDFLLNDK